MKQENRWLRKRRNDGGQRKGDREGEGEAIKKKKEMKGNGKPKRVLGCMKNMQKQGRKQWKVTGRKDGGKRKESGREEERIKGGGKT